MRTHALLATALAALLLLSSCAPSSSPGARASSTTSSTPIPTASTPAFLATPQVESDYLPAGVASTVGVGEDSTRYEGDWDGHQVFLALKKDSSVCLVTGIPQNLDSWVAQCGRGDEVITWKADDGDTVKYLPMTTTATPDGWTRISDYVFAI